MDDDAAVEAALAGYVPLTPRSPRALELQDAVIEHLTTRPTAPAPAAPSRQELVEALVAARVHLASALAEIDRVLGATA